tara:strand:+ start:212 stop:442 length:231 start_codon:yes stop_codon:yes gene_type:complete
VTVVPDTEVEIGAVAAIVIVPAPVIAVPLPLSPAGVTEVTVPEVADAATAAIVTLVPVLSTSTVYGLLVTLTLVIE